MELEDLREVPPWEWPENTPDAIRKNLKNRQAEESVRELAAHMAGDLTVMNDEFAGLLLGILADGGESDRLCGVAAISLGPVLEMADMAMDDLDDEAISAPMFAKILESLKSLYFDEKTPKEVRRRILEASVRAEGDWHAEEVRKVSKSEDKEWRITAIFCMGLLPDFDRQILAELKNPDVDLYREAILAAGGRELKGAWSDVSALLRDQRAPKPLRLAAIDAAANIQPKKAKPMLAELTDSPDVEIAEAAAEALAMADDFTDEGDWEEE